MKNNAMNKIPSKILVVIITLLIGLSGALFAAEYPSLPKEETASLLYLKEVYLTMNKHYYKELRGEKVAVYCLESAKKMMELLDPKDKEYMEKVKDITYWNASWMVEALKDPSDKYSGFLYKDRVAQFMRKNLKSSFPSIGIEIEKREGLFYVVNVYEGSSAEKQGVRVGDELQAIDGAVISSLEPRLVEAKFPSVEGESVTLRLLHGGEIHPYEVVLYCHVVVIPSVSKDYFTDTNIGYIKISEFRESTGEEFTAAFEELKVKKYRGLIIDVRGNGGGETEQVLPVTGHFIPPDNLMVYFAKRDVGRQQYKTRGIPDAPPGPVVILVNKGSGSSAEVFSGVMHYYKKAQLVGSQTMGLWALKNTFGLRDGSLLYLITSRTYLPDGETFDQVGLTPDVVVPEPEQQLKKAIEVIVNKE
jgi:carboxyl-terminal processing protease